MTATKPSFNNFFELFSQSAQFDIDISKLSPTLKKLQRQYHPDNQSLAKSSGQNDETHGVSAIINQAYDTLFYPDRRAEYLLELASVPFDNNQSISDESFLQSAMMIRMDMMETDSISNITNLHTQTQKFISDASEQFKLAYQNQHWQDAIVATQKLKFMVKLDADIKKRLDDLASADLDDNDLYL